MKAFAVAALAAAALAAPNPDKTVYQTDEVTITSCGPEVTNCPARSHSATATPDVTPSASSPAEATSSSVAGGSAPPASGTPVAGSPSAGTPPAQTPEVSYTHSTIYSTLLSTITTGSSSGGVVTQTVAISTTYCPVEATETGVQGGSAPTPSAPAPSSGVPALGTPGVGGGSSCAPVYSTKTVYVTPGVPVGTGSVPYPSGGPYATPYAGTPGVPATPVTPGAGTPTPATPTPNYTGAANAVNAAGAVAGMGAFAAFFL